MSPRDLSRFSAVLVGLLTAAVSLAQQATIPARSVIAPDAKRWTPVTESPRFGTVDLTYVRLNGTDFFPFNSPEGYLGVAGSLRRYPGAGGFNLEATPHFPSGAIIDYFELDYCDTGASDLSGFLVDCGPTGINCSTIISTVAPTGTPGCATVSQSGLNYTVNNATSTFDIEVIFAATNGTLSVGGAVVGYRLQVSPAPGVATFPLDVPTNHPFFRYIEALADAGITAGTAPGEFSPDQAVTRGQMAVFLSIALGLHFPN